MLLYSLQVLVNKTLINFILDTPQSGHSRKVMDDRSMHMSDLETPKPASHTETPLAIKQVGPSTQWLRVRASDSRLREPGFESCAVVLKPWASFFTLCCSSSLSFIKELLSTWSGYRQWWIYVCTSNLRALIVAYGWMLPREAEMVSE